MKNPFTGMFSRTPDPHLSAQHISETKSAAPLVALELSSAASWTPRHYGALAREGYERNPIVYRCIRLVAEAAASVPLSANVPAAQTLLRRGHPGQTGMDVMESFYGHLQVGGNAYLEAGLLGGVPAALYALRPDRMSVRTSRQGWPCGYAYDGGAGGGSGGGATGAAMGTRGRREFRCDMASGRTPVFHMRLLHPAHDTLGFSPLEAAAQAVDIHNAGGRWTKALLDNSARPSGALIYKAGEGTQMSDDQFARIKAELEGAYAGARHAGRPMVLEGGLEWRSMSLSPADMDFLEARREAAREISLALGVPPMLLGIPGDNTYANYKEANLAFWRQTIIPLVTKTARGLEGWLRPWLGEELNLRPDLDAVPALSAERGLLWERLSAAAFLTDIERRTLAGLEASS